MSKIPKILHCIWVGPNPAPMKWISSRQEKHPDWEYVLRGNKELRNTNRVNKKIIDFYSKKGKRNGVADCMRYEILYNHGGALHGADWLCLNNIEDLFQDGYEAYQIDTSHYGDGPVDLGKKGCAMPLFACEKGFEGAKTLIDLVGKIEKYGSPPKTTGNWLMHKLNNEYNYKIKTIPIHQFIPEHFNGRKYTGPDKIYSKHFRGTTKGTYEQGL